LVGNDNCVRCIDVKVELVAKCESNLDRLGDRETIISMKGMTSVGVVVYVVMFERGRFS